MSKIFKKFTKLRGNHASSPSATPGEPSDPPSASTQSQTRQEPSAKTTASKQPRPAQKIGLVELAEGRHDEEKTVDVVAVHGLQGDLYETWTHENGTMWLESILPDKIRFARIMTFGYESTIAFSSSAAKLEDKSIDLINRLSIKRSSVENGSKRPIVFVCHSLGGILVKKALILAHDRSSDAHYKDILDNTKAIAFLGVPHRGANSAWWASFAANSLKGASLGLSTNTALVKDLQKSSPTLATISEQFVERGKHLKIYTFYETRKLSGMVVVDKQSASLNLPNEKLFPVDANHGTICRIPSPESQEFEAVGAWVADLARWVITNTSPNLQLYFEVPNRRVFPFFGRKNIMSKIDRALSVGPGPCVTVVQGIGGQGKSQVAMEYCHQKRDGLFPSIFWIDATSENSVTRTLISISGIISTATDQLLDDNARVAFVNRKFASWPTRLLLVFDNYDYPKEFPNIRDFFPLNKLVSILVTGRHAEISSLVLGQRANLIELPGLEESAAIELLEHHSQVEETTSKFGEEIVKRLGCHALAITQAGTYIRKGGIRLSEFIDIYNQEKEEILNNTPELSQYRRKLGDAENETSLNVFTTWQLSFQQLLSNTSEDSITVKLLRLLAFFDNKDISEWIFIQFYRNKITEKTSELLEWIDGFSDNQNRWNSRLFKKNLVMLQDFCLLQSVTQSSDNYNHASLHPLVKDWIKLQMGKSACQQYAFMVMKILCDLLCAVYEKQHFQLPLDTKQSLALHVIAQEENNSEYLGIDPTKLHQDLLTELVDNQAWSAKFLKELGLYNKAELIEVQVVDTRKKVLGVEHSETLTGMSNLALTYWNQGRWEEAEPLEVQVLEARKKVLGSEHPDTLTAMSNLAVTYSNQDRLDKAEPLQVQVLEATKRVLGAEHPDTLRSMDILALTYVDLGRLEEAEPLQVQALETWKKVLGAEHPDTLICMSSLASTYWSQGRLEEAESLEVQVMDTRKRLLWAEHPETLRSMHNLAFTWKDLGREIDALKLMEECVKLRTRILGASHRDTLSSSKKLLIWQEENSEESWSELEGD